MDRVAVPFADNTDFSSNYVFPVNLEDSNDEKRDELRNYMHENGIHDYLKFVKLGYGRGSDHACKDIRAGRMTREEGIVVEPHDVIVIHMMSKMLVPHIVIGPVSRTAQPAHEAPEHRVVTTRRNTRL